MMTDEIDRILLHEEEILPSSGFAVSVMEAVRREAAAPQPIPFPWKRALPGLILAGGALIAVVVGTVIGMTYAFRQPSAVNVPFSWIPWATSILPGARPEAAWLAGTLLATLASVAISFRVASGRA
jgi:hypothetical protein